MTISPKDSRLMLLISSILIVVPMVIFPAKLGTELGTGSFIYASIEVIYYGAFFFILRPGSNLFQTVGWEVPVFLQLGAIHY